MKNMSQLKTTLKFNTVYFFLRFLSIVQTYTEYFVELFSRREICVTKVYH